MIDLLRHGWEMSVEMSVEAGEIGGDLGHPDLIVLAGEAPACTVDEGGVQPAFVERIGLMAIEDVDLSHVGRSLMSGSRNGGPNREGPPARRVFDLCGNGMQLVYFW